ncbi:MAG: protein-disulfide isomerase [Parcubacteria group bacterium Gr01-1014_18]|nr:MAG: protein-disulfide isomerase [Parcubacteria group bacterium Greene0416_36]TSC81097.1 MAG: protein-disulfide isomerase [Parcubacteria group bacterium Gr01-1014_18]TSC98487.1 MAG: protein-disulfide isomerase [Parcubacteria group bacterium Greene1014_20]TSD07348.1 MAG: protein-disulfide isomerase [Parcubacteria group bacterium Greene0714_2]
MTDQQLNRITVLGVILVIIAGIVGLYWSSRPGVSIPEVAAISDHDWVKGNKDSGNLLVEYSDFQCPACSFYSSIVEELAKEMGDKLAFVYRHHPLSIHPYAESAAAAAEAAGTQGKFWEMHDLLFKNQSVWSASADPEAAFVSYAESLSLNVEKFKTDMDSRAARGNVRADYLSSLSLGIDSTPTFVWNGQKLADVPGNYLEFKKMIEVKLTE